MSEATEIVKLSAPYIQYIVPAVLIFSCISVAEYMFDFMYGLFDRYRTKRKRYL